MNRAILVKSCQKFAARRQACQCTWAGELWTPRKVPLWYVYANGVTNHCPNPLGGPVYLECGDGYESNSFKLREALRRILFYCEVSFDSLFICDDDTFVHPKRWLAHEPAGEFECRLHQPTTDHEKRLNGGRPWANGGAGWWMSRRLCQLYVEQVTERCSWDDVLATRIAQDNHVEIVDRPDLYSCDRYGDSAWRVSADNPVITCHPVEPTEMVEMWEACRGL